ncbi:class D sortase [Peribacillus alkalitolerans]|uniref:class D sortase n=1 Tax=Peribacillus alkalitolerans TaxID=1550385 RepID=UPI0013D55208|nr:class D sortase [Peribacillus alkalitolerans]
MPKKRLILVLSAVLLAVGGIYFSTTSAYKLLMGYGIYQWDKHVKAETETVENKTEGTTSKKKDEPLYSVRPQIGEMMGELYIPKLDESLPIYHGTDEDELEKGVGHFAQSVLPGEIDNSVLSGHRDTVFRRLGEVGKGDSLVVKTSAGTFTYKVKRVRIVDKDDRTVIVPKPKATLTVTTCYPFNFIGSAPQRYVLVAELNSKQ